MLTGSHRAITDQWLYPLGDGDPIATELAWEIAERRRDTVGAEARRDHAHIWTVQVEYLVTSPAHTASLGSADLYGAPVFACTRCSRVFTPAEFSRKCPAES